MEKASCHFTFIPEALKMLGPVVDRGPRSKNDEVPSALRRKRTQAALLIHQTDEYTPLQALQDAPHSASHCFPASNFPWHNMMCACLGAFALSSNAVFSSTIAFTETQFLSLSPSLFKWEQQLSPALFPFPYYFCFFKIFFFLDVDILKSLLNLLTILLVLCLGFLAASHGRS